MFWLQPVNLVLAQMAHMQQTFRSKYIYFSCFSVDLYWRTFLSNPGIIVYPLESLEKPRISNNLFYFTKFNLMLCVCPRRNSPYSEYPLKFSATVHPWDGWILSKYITFKSEYYKQVFADTWRKVVLRSYIEFHILYRIDKESHLDFSLFIFLSPTNTFAILKEHLS